MRVSAAWFTDVVDSITRPMRAGMALPTPGRRARGDVGPVSCRTGWWCAASVARRITSTCAVRSTLKSKAKAASSEQPATIPSDRQTAPGAP